MVQLHENIVVLMRLFYAPKNVESFGHVDAFNDPLWIIKIPKTLSCRLLIESVIDKLEENINKEVEKAAKRFGESFDEKMYRETNPRCAEYAQKPLRLKNSWAKL